MSVADPYRVLEVSRRATDAEVRAAYRRAVQRHHPDHNGGSPESAKRFEEVQQAYAQIRAQRESRSRGSSARATGARTSGTASDTASTTDPGLDARLAAMEAELAAARDAATRARRAASDAVRDVRETARGAARDAARGASRRPTDEELGYVSTDDSLSSILDDTLSGLSEQISSARRRADAAKPGGAVTDKVADALEDIAARLRGEHKDRRDG